MSLFKVSFCHGATDLVAAIARRLFDLQGARCGGGATRQADQPKKASQTPHNPCILGPEKMRTYLTAIKPTCA